MLRRFCLLAGAAKGGGQPCAKGKEYIFPCKIRRQGAKQSRQNAINVCCMKPPSSEKNMDRTGKESDLIAKSS